MKKFKQRISKAFSGGAVEEREGQMQIQIGTEQRGHGGVTLREKAFRPQQRPPHPHGDSIARQLSAASFASSSSQFFPGSSVPVDPFIPSKYFPAKDFSGWNRSRYRWSLSDSLSHINERIGPMTVQEEGIAGGESAKGGKADETTAKWGDKERPKHGAAARPLEAMPADTTCDVPVVVMRAKKQQIQQRHFQSKIKSWHAPRWFGNAVHAASASLSLSSSSNNVPKLGSDGESVAEMSSPSTSGETGTAGDTRGTTTQQKQLQQQQMEYVPNVRLRNKKKKTPTTALAAGNVARKRMSEQEIQKRLSLPAYITIPSSVLDKLSRQPILGDSQLSRKNRRASLSEIGFGKVETYRKIVGLGEGTYANVFLGQSLLTGRSVALKEIRLEHEEGAPCTAIREVSLLRNLKHCNIVTLHDVIHTDNLLTLVFEYVEKDLREYMEQLQQPICLPNIRLFLVQLLRGLAYCHAKRILHRDLKPQNLLISKNGELKLADFGLARAQSVPTKSYTAEVVTLWYRPPDVLLGSTDYSTHIDMWGVGCILFEMLARKPMFPGNKVEDQLDLIYRKLGTPTPQLHPRLCALPAFNCHPRHLRRHSPRALVCLASRITHERADLLQRLLAYEDKNRLSALEAMRHPFLKCFPEAIFGLPDTESVFSLPDVFFHKEKSANGNLENENGQKWPLTDEQ
ncbi:hypothetical protein niasHT_003833 [Heterodera trifolii]|uniref:cyclin-dependent kinase n=1 Tax=Heterodera trifolii TaxID=157864 RepID=A0ABD2LWS8_9BILA